MITPRVRATAAPAIAASLFEPAGIPSAATINAIGYTVWPLWLIWLRMPVIAGKAMLASAAP